MKTAYVNGYILDGTENMVPEAGKVIIVEDKKIVAVEPKETAKLEGCEVIDLKGKYILPGMINLHVHLPGTGKPSKKQINLPLICKLLTCCGLGRKVGASMGARAAKAALLSGTTTLRTVGGISVFDTQVRDEIQSGQRIGARLLAADCAISVEGGHMAGTFAHIAHSAEEAAALVDKIAERKPDLIKLMITGGIMDTDSTGAPGKVLMPESYVKAACDRAHALGYQVAAHCEGTEGIRMALKNGVDTIEHGSFPDQEILDLYKARGAAHVITISPALPYANEFPGMFNSTRAAVENARVLLNGMVEMAKACLQEGIPVGLGTDSSCTYVTQYGFWREIAYFVKYCGVTPAFAIHTATQVNAEIAGIGDLAGTIEAGKSADMFVVDRDPINDLTALDKPSMVIFEGKRYDDPKPDRYPEVDAVLDKLA